MFIYRSARRKSESTTLIMQEVNVKNSAECFLSWILKVLEFKLPTSKVVPANFSLHLYILLQNVIVCGMCYGTSLRMIVVSEFLGM